VAGRWAWERSQVWRLGAVEGINYPIQSGALEHFLSQEAGQLKRSLLREKAGTVWRMVGTLSEMRWQMVVQIPGSPHCA